MGNPACDPAPSPPPKPQAHTRTWAGIGPIALVLALTLVLTLGLLLVPLAGATDHDADPGAGPDDQARYPQPGQPPGEAGWTFISRDRLQASPDDPLLVIDLWSSDPLPLAPGASATFLVEIFDHADDTPVVPGPDLRLSVAHCHTRIIDPQEQDCQGERIIATETRHTLVDEPAGQEDGRYLWSPPEQRALAETGTWRMKLWLESEDDEQTARFMLDVQPAFAPMPWIVDLLFALMGIGVGPFGRFLVFAFWVGFFIISAGIIAAVLRRTVLNPHRVDPTVRRLSIRLFNVLWILLGVAFAMWIGWRVNFWAALAAVGLLSVALGFGMQNTVANIMGGVNLALDKPFIVGDRIRIGETWGEVEEVGIRSTRIATTKKETVIIPNKLMDEREIWNYTTNQPELRRDIEVMISYDADRHLAEVLLLEAAREHPAILPYPRPRVYLREFADHGLLLQLRAWIADARDLRPIGSELRKNIMDKFEEHQVEIPYPYRTLVEKKDLPSPERASEKVIEAHLPPDERMPRLLYATAGPEPLAKTASLVARIARDLDMQLLVLHIQPEFNTARRADAYRIMAAFQQAATHHKVSCKPITREGKNIIDEIKRTIIQEDVDLLMVGSSRHPFRWSHRAVADFTREIRKNAKIPVFLLPRNLEVSPRTLKHYRELMEERHIGKRREAKLTSDQENDEEGEEDEKGEEGKGRSR